MCCTTRGCCDGGPTLPSTSIEEAEMTVTTTERDTAVEPAEPPSYGLSDRTRRGRRLGGELTAPAGRLVLAGAFELVIGFVFAMVMNKIIFGRRTVRTAILLPYGIITVVSAFAWKYAFALDSGFVSSWLGWAVGHKYNWFGHRSSALLVICLEEIWKTTPFISLLLLAGLSQVPEVLQEAAKVDGATFMQRLWKVTIPNMKAAIMVAVLFRALDAWRIFESIFIMTAGAQKTESLSFLTYRQNITRVALGIGSAVSVLLFLTMVIIAAVFLKGFKVDLGTVKGEAR